MLISAVNVSEGRRYDTIAAIAAAAGDLCHLLDVHSDPDHNRSIITVAGEPGPLVEGVLAAVREAVALIDLGAHAGAHPRLGAIDVVPFAGEPDLRPSAVSGQEAVAASRLCAERIWTELAVPCFLYESSADDQNNLRTLPAVRRAAFSKLQPDYGGPRPHKTAGAVTLGARPMLVAFNINLDTTDIGAGRRIAAGLRARLGYVRALGFGLPSKGLVQVSCNLIRPGTTTMGEVFETTAEMAHSEGAQILESEVAGLATRASLGGFRPSSLRLTRQPKVLEDCLERVRAGAR